MDRTPLAPPQRVRSYRSKHLHRSDSLLFHLRNRQLWTKRPLNCEKFLPRPRNSLPQMSPSLFAYEDDDVITRPVQPSRAVPSFSILPIQPQPTRKNRPTLTFH